jgi:hypothetical protein
VIVAALAADLLFALCMLASALSLVLRFRRAGGEERQQVKWIAFASSVVVIVTVITMAATLLSPAAAWFAGNTPVWLSLMQYSAQASLTAVPIAVGFAVLKYRLYDIDIIINRALVYGPLTATLVLVYFGGLFVLQSVFRALTGQESTIAIVASTLAIVALFVPLRRRVQSFVDRRFYRRKYDAAKTLASFSVRHRQETDLGTLSDDLVRVVSETLQPVHASLWLRPEVPPRDEQADLP